MHSSALCGIPSCKWSISCLGIVSHRDGHGKMLTLFSAKQAVERLVIWERRYLAANVRLPIAKAVEEYEIASGKSYQTKSTPINTTYHNPHSFVYTPRNRKFNA